MAEENTDQTTEAPAGAAAYTDEQLSEAFPGQDINHVKSMLDKAAGIGVPLDPDKGADNDANGDKQQAGEGGSADSEGEGDSDETEYPEWIPSKFRKGSVEDATKAMAEAYSVLESAAGRARSGAGDSDSGDDDNAGGGADDNDEGPHIDLRSLEAEYVNNGSKATEELYKKAESAGLDRATLDAFLAGQTAIANQLVSSVHELVGGATQYDAMLQWMIGNVEETEVEAYDATMATGNQAQIKNAVRGMKAAYDAALGKDPSIRIKGDNGTPAVQGFQSKREMIDAMKDPRYQKDANYRKQVEKRIENGNVW